MPQNFLKFLFVSLTLWSFSEALAQDFMEKRVKLPPGNYSPKDLLTLLREQGLSVAYSSDKIPASKCAVLEDTTYSIHQLLRFISECSGINYKVKGNSVIINYDKANEKRYLRGIVRDAETGEVLIGASVQRLGTRTPTGVITNKYGYYSLALTEGVYVLKVSFMGYHDLMDTVEFKNKSKIRNLNLVPKTEFLDAVVVSSIEPDYNVSSLIPGTNTLDLSTKGEIPYFLGEVDVLQGATLLPGIKSLGEDANGLNIRGSNTDENLVMLDEATVYNPNHLFGLISVFNPEAVNNVEIMKGFIPPAYGGRASSVITVHQKEGNNQEFHVTGGIGLISAKFIAEGPLKRNESSFIISGRQSLLDVNTFTDISSRSSFHDLNAKINWKFNKKNTFYFSSYIGGDHNINVLKTERNWGNQNYSFRWNHLFGKRTFANFSSIISRYNYRITQPQEAASYIGTSQITDYTMKSDWAFTINPNHEINYGSITTFHRLHPGDRVPYNAQSSSSTVHMDSEFGFESALYVSHKAKFGEHFSTLYGLRLSSLYDIGPKKVYVYDASQAKSDQSIIDTLHYSLFKIVKKYYGWEPRASMTYRFSPSTSLKASYSRTFQYIHLISSTISPSPTDIWKLSDTYIPPTESNQVSLGLYKNFHQNQWESYIEGYYKVLSNTVEYKQGADLLFNANLETELLKGHGRAYGLEFFLKRNTGRLTGWISYTLSRSEVRVKGKYDSETINNGEYYPSDYDKTHDLSVVGIYEILPRLSASFTFNFSTGRPYTYPIGKYYYEGNLVPQYGFRNQDRLPNYHRLDLSVKWQSKKFKKDGTYKNYQDYWTLVVYNVYGRNNVYSYTYDEDASTGQTTITPYSIFSAPIVGITYHFKF